MKRITKRSILIAALVAASSGSVQGENGSRAVPLSDADLDSVTAGSAFVVLGIHNPGRVPETASGMNPTNHVFRCINCAEVEAFPTTTGLLFVWKPGTSPATHPEGSFMRPIGNARF